MAALLYQYKSGSEQWEELRYSLRSLSNLSFDHKVYIVGDKPDWLKNVIHIPHTAKDRSTDQKYKVLRALQKLQERFFVLMYDDQYFIRETGLEGLKTTRGLWYSNKQIKSYKEYGSGWEKNLLIPTLEYLDTNISFETHLPRVFYKQEILKTMYKHDLTNNNYLFPTCYFNDHASEVHVVDKKSCIGVRLRGYDDKYSYSHMDAEELRSLPPHKKILNHNNKGLTSEVKRYLQGLFPEKSRYEKQ